MECQSSLIVGGSDSTTTAGDLSHTSFSRESPAMGITCKHVGSVRSFEAHAGCALHSFSHCAEYQKVLGYFLATVSTRLLEICSSCEKECNKSETREHGCGLHWPKNLQQPQLRSLQFEGRRACYGSLHNGLGGAPHVVRARDGVFVRWLHASRHARRHV